MERSITYKHHSDLFRQLTEKHGGYDLAPRDLSDLELELSGFEADDTEERAIERNFEKIAQVIFQYMFEENIGLVHIEVPNGLKDRHGVLMERLAFTLDDDKHIFSAVAGLAGFYYAVDRRSTRTLIDDIEELVGESLEVADPRKLARKLSTKDNFESVRELSLEYSRRSFPPPAKKAFRIFLDHDFFFNFAEVHTGIFTMNNMAHAIANCSLYFPEIVFKHKPFRSREEGAIAEELKLFAALRPLIQRGAVHPINIDMATDRWVHTCLPTQMMILTDYEEQFRAAVERAGRDAGTVSFMEFAEVFAERSVLSTLCGASNMYSWREFFEFSEVMANYGIPLLGTQTSEYYEANLFSNLVLPTLEGCTVSDILTVINSGEHLRAFRDDLSVILRDHVGRWDPIGEEISELGREFLSARSEALSRDMRTTSMRKRLKDSSISVSIGTLIGLMTTGEPISSVLGGLATEAAVQGYKVVTGRRKRSPTEALVEIYGQILKQGARA